MQSVYALASNNFISSGNKYGVEVDDDADGSDIDGDDYSPSQQAPKMKKANEPAWTIKDGSISKASQWHPQQSLCNCPINES